jgi:hypothetical protein
MAKGVKIRVKSKPGRTLKQTITKDTTQNHHIHITSESPNPIRRDPIYIGYFSAEETARHKTRTSIQTSYSVHPPSQPLTNKARNVHIK